MRRISLPLLPILVLVFLVHSPGTQGQEALTELVSRIPARETGDGNRFSLTDVQYALRARLDWNALLQRVRVINEESAFSFTLVVGSSLGSCGSQLVEWPQAPTIRNGQIFVSEGLLRVVFQSFPDFRLEGQSEETLETPPVANMEEMALEEPPELYNEETPKDLKKVMAVFMTSKAEVGNGTGTANTASQTLSSRLSEKVEQQGLTLNTLIWSPENEDATYQNGDALVAFQVISASPTPPSSFLYYDSPSLPNPSRGNSLVEWDRVSPQQKVLSRSLAEAFQRNFSEVFGSNRTIGVRGAPIQFLQGRRVPSIQINLGISSASEEAEIEKMVEVVNRSLSQLKSEG